MRNRNLLLCPKCRAQIGECTPNGLKIGLLTLMGVIRITCDNSTEPGRMCNKRITYRPPKNPKETKTEKITHLPPKSPRETNTGNKPDTGPLQPLTVVC